MKRLPLSALIVLVLLLLPLCAVASTADGFWKTPTIVGGFPFKFGVGG